MFRDQKDDIEGQTGEISSTVVHCCCQMIATATVWFVNDKETIISTSYVLDKCLNTLYCFFVKFFTALIVTSGESNI